MAKIPLTDGYSIIPEGTHIFKITEVIYKESFGKLEVKMETSKGLKHTERFTLIDAKGKPNEGAYNAFSFFAKTALNNYELTEIDHNDLVGHYIECVVKHDVQPSNKTPGKTVTFIRLTDKAPVVVGEAASTATKTAAPVAAKAGNVNLDDILG